MYINNIINFIDLRKMVDLVGRGHENVLRTIADVIATALHSNSDRNVTNETGRNIHNRNSSPVQPMELLSNRDINGIPVERPTTSRSISPDSDFEHVRIR